MLPHDPEKTLSRFDSAAPRPPTPSEPQETREDVDAEDPEKSNYPTLFGKMSPRKDSHLPRQFGNYELLEEIARGGMGIVYKARQLSTDRLVALKMILAGKLASDDSVQRFHREVKAAARLDHPGIVHVFESGEVDDLYFFSMAYVPGGSLHDLIQEGPLSSREAARMVQLVAEAVQYAHDKGIIHRDIKPHNILLTWGGEQGVEGWREETTIRDQGSDLAKREMPISAPTSRLSPRITDFGLARIEASDLSLTGEVMGTPSYMPPEQAAGRREEIGPASDVYSLGAVLYCLVTGRPPFQSVTAMETMRQVLEEEPVSPRKLNTAVPPDLETICLKCLAKEPKRRFASARELAEELQRFQAGETIHARPVGWPERAWRWARRNPRLATLAATLVVVILVSLIGLTALYQHAEIKREEAQDQRREAQRLQQLAETRAQETLDQKKQVEKQSQRAQEEAHKARMVADVMLGMFEASDPFDLNSELGFVIPRQTGELLTARELLDRGAKKAEDMLKDQPLLQAAVQDSIGNVYRSLNQYPQAEKLLTSALEIRRRHLGEDHLDFATSLHHMGWLIHERGNYLQAEALYRQALVIRRKHLEPDHPLVTDSLLNLAWVLADKGQRTEAVEMLEKVISLRRQRLGNEHRDVLVALIGLASVHLDNENYLAALKPGNEAMELCRKLEGNSSITQALVKFQQALMAGRVFGNHTSAERSLRESLELIRKRLGNEHVYTALLLYQLADCLDTQGKTTEAEIHYRESLGVVRRTVGLGHPRVATLVKSFGKLLSRQGKKKEADQLFEELLTAHRERFGEEHFFVADALVWYGEVLQDRSEPMGVEKVLTKAVRIYRQEKATGRMRYAPCLNNLGMAYLNQDKNHAAAEKLFREAIACVREHYGKRHLNMAVVLDNLATALMAQGKFAEVEAFLLDSVTIAKEAGSKGKNARTTALRSLTRFYREKGQLEKAATTALERRDLWPNDPEQLVEVAEDLALCAAGVGRNSRLSSPMAQARSYEDLALAVLRRARASGYKDSAYLKKSSPLQSLNDREEFQQLLREMEKAGRKQP